MFSLFVCFSGVTDYQSSLGRRAELLARIQGELVGPLLTPHQQQAEARQRTDQEDPLRIRHAGH